MSSPQSNSVSWWRLSGLCKCIDAICMNGEILVSLQHDIYCKLTIVVAIRVPVQFSVTYLKLFRYAVIKHEVQKWIKKQCFTVPCILCIWSLRDWKMQQCRSHINYWLNTFFLKFPIRYLSMTTWDMESAPEHHSWAFCKEQGLEPELILKFKSSRSSIQYLEAGVGYMAIWKAYASYVNQRA